MKMAYRMLTVVCWTAGYIVQRLLVQEEPTDHPTMLCSADKGVAVCMSAAKLHKVTSDSAHKMTLSPVTNIGHVLPRWRGLAAHRVLTFEFMRVRSRLSHVGGITAEKALHVGCLKTACHLLLNRIGSATLQQPVSLSFNVVTGAATVGAHSTRWCPNLHLLGHATRSNPQTRGFAGVSSTQ